MALKGYEEVQLLSGGDVATVQQIADFVVNGHVGVSTDGHLVFKTIPTADPHIAGAVWSNSGVLTISAG